MAVFIGGECDPKPVFRDERPDAFDWPEGAVMAVTFGPEWASVIALDPGEMFPQTEFFGVDGWPVNFPAAEKSRLPESVARQLQIHPWRWRRWSREFWRRLHDWPEGLERASAQASIIAAIVPHTSSLDAMK